MVKRCILVIIYHVNDYRLQINGQIEVETGRTEGIVKNTSLSDNLYQ